MNVHDITKDVTIKLCDDEGLWIKCACGYDDNFWISIYKDSPTECPKCKRKLYFSSVITVYEVTE